MQDGRIRDTSKGMLTGHSDRLGMRSKGREGSGMTGSGDAEPCPPIPQLPTSLRLFSPHGVLQWGCDSSMELPPLNILLLQRRALSPPLPSPPLPSVQAQAQPLAPLEPVPSSAGR